MANQFAQALKKRSGGRPQTEEKTAGSKGMGRGEIDPPCRNMGAVFSRGGQNGLFLG